MPRSPRRWTEAEDELLRKEVMTRVSEGEVKDWRAIATKIRGRTNKDCRKRWHNVLSGGSNKGHWTQAEDLLLSQAVHEYGECWTVVAGAVQTRTTDQCARRWKQCLNPQLDKGDWSEEENRILLEAYARKGSQWQEIQMEYFPARSRNAIKNQYTVLTRRINKTGAPAEPREMDIVTDKPKGDIPQTEASGDFSMADSDLSLSNGIASNGDNHELLTGNGNFELRESHGILEYCQQPLDNMFFDDDFNSSGDLELAGLNDEPEPFELLSLGEPAMGHTDLQAPLFSPYACIDSPWGDTLSSQPGLSSNIDHLLDGRLALNEREGRSTQRITLSVDKPSYDTVNLLLRIAESNNSEIRFEKNASS